MNKYQKQNNTCFAGALICILISTVFAVALQFFKGDVLDLAIAGDTPAAIRRAALLLVFILCEILFYYCYRQCGARFVTGCTKLLKRRSSPGLMRRIAAPWRSF